LLNPKTKMSNLKQSNLTEIVKTEQELLEKAPSQYGEFFAHAIESYKLLQSFVRTIKDEGWLFVAFFAHIKKHSLLALLSTVRLHHVQAVMNLRQVLESGANAAYALGNPNSDDFARVTKEGIINLPKNLKNIRYKWLNDNYPKGSNAIKTMKKALQIYSHSNIVDVHRTFKYEENDGIAQLATTYFDFENDFQTKSNLWSIANIYMGLMDLFYGINLKAKVITFSPDLVERLQEIDRENKRLKKILMGTTNFKRADKIAKSREERLKKEISS